MGLPLSRLAPHTGHPAFAHDSSFLLNSNNHAAPGFILEGACTICGSLDFPRGIRNLPCGHVTCCYHDPSEQLYCDKEEDNACRHAACLQTGHHHKEEQQHQQQQQQQPQSPQLGYHRRKGIFFREDEQDSEEEDYLDWAVSRVYGSQRMGSHHALPFVPFFSDDRLLSGVRRSS